MSSCAAVIAGLTLVTPPASEPVTLVQAKAWLKRGDSAEDDTLGVLLKAARQQVEADTGLALLTQTVDVAVDVLPDSQRFLRLPVGPLQAIVSVTTYDRSSVSAVWDPSNYFVDTYSLPPRLCLANSACWPRCLRPQVGVVVRARIGFDDAAAPEWAVVAIQMRLAQYSENREGFTEAEQRVYDWLIESHRMVWLA